jgi:hypothetical protein
LFERFRETRFTMWAAICDSGRVFAADVCRMQASE